MESLLIPAEIAGAILVLCLIVLVAIFVRRFQLARKPGAFDLSVRAPGKSWSVGVARYAPGRLDWYEVFSLSPRPKRAFEQNRLEIVGRRAPANLAVLAPSTTIVRCRYRGTEIDFILSESDYFGLSSWAESAPPGRGNYTAT